MIRSMSSALSGLRNHQLMLDVVGNDIANVSTVGFKGSSAQFSDVLSQTLGAAGAPAGGLGGTNPAQIGLGSQLVATVQSFTQGALQRTGRSTDLAIQGDGFFVVQAGPEQLYTRAGSLTLDAAGNLTTAEGRLVQGWQATTSGAIDTNLPMSTMRIGVGDLLPPAQTTGATMGGNLSADAAIGDELTLTVTVFDPQGTAQPLNLTFEKTAADEWTVAATAGAPPAAVALTDNVLTFDGDGELTAPADYNVNIAGGAIPGFTDPISIGLGGPGASGRLTQFGGTTTAAVLGQNGYEAGSLQSFDVSQDGVIIGSYSNGRSRPIGQLAMAVFANPEGLERVAGGWRQTANSGLAQIGQPGSGGRGLLAGRQLEMSNVDLAEEFARLIVAQRGFQGNARVVTTADEVLQEVVNLRR